MAGHADPKYVFDYDPVDQLIGATVRSNGIAGAVLRRYAYGYDKGGNRTSEQTDLGVSTATHNDVNQLTGVSASAGPVKFAGRLSETGIVYVANSLATMGIQNTSFVAYASLSNGTREVEVRATDYSNQSATNRYQVVITNNGVAKTLSYDINGNLTNVAATTYTNKYEWDGANRLTKISWRQTGGGWHVTDFTYDGLGRRVKITETTNNVAATNTFLWCGTELCEERNTTGATVNKRFFGQGEQISGTAYFFTRDHLGSIREMINSGGTIQARYEYDPYGRRTKVSGSSESDFAFTGHYYHQKSGLHLALYRAYDADTGRWLSRDPIEEEGGRNLYGYVANSPVIAVDGDGLAPQLTSITYNGNTDSLSAGYRYSRFGADTNMKRKGTSFGIALSGSGTLAPTGIGVHGEVTGGLGLFPGNDPVGGYASGGASAGPGGILSPNNPGVEDLEFNPAIGGFLGAGGGVWLSNAQCPADLERTERTVSVDLGAAFGGDFGIALSYGDGVWHLHIGVKAAVNQGFMNVSSQRTKTITTKHR